MATVLDLGKESLSEIGVLAAGEAPSGPDGALILSKLNSLVDQWASERLMIHTVTRTTWTLVADQASYTVGSGGGVNIAWPSYIEGFGYIDTDTDPDQEYPLGPPLTDDMWERVTQKALSSTRPVKVYYNPTFPLGTLNLWPVPSLSTLQGVIYHPTAVTEFAGLSTAVSLPPGYRRMIVKNLALDLAPSFGVQPSRELEIAAGHSVNVVKRKNTPVLDQSFDFMSGPGGSYQIEADE